MIQISPAARWTGRVLSTLAVLFKGWPGGALASHLRHGDPLFSHILFPTYIGFLLWLGLALRDPRATRVFAPRTSEASA